MKRQREPPDIDQKTSKLVRGVRRGDLRAAERATERINLRVTPSDKRLVESAAEKLGMTVAEFLVGIARHAAARL
jgi:hypothetical protein